MPWIRIDENAMDHPKFLALTDGAWRLWCEGLSYCQKHLTDGVIQASALRGFRYFSTARLKNLTAELIVGKGPCWHQADNGEIRVHDYLEWNDSRQDVLDAREGARNRRRRHEQRNALWNASGDANETSNVPSGVVGFVGDHLEAGKERTQAPVQVQRERFDGFWAVYPRKIGKEAAWRQWQKIKPSLELAQQIVAKVGEQSASPQWRKDGGQFIPHPRTWLYQGRWQDEVDRAGVVRKVDNYQPSQFAQRGPSDRDLELIAQYERTKVAR